MDLQYYQYVLTIVECRSVSKAAEKLHISQPHLSAILSRMEKEFGAEFFDRTRLPIHLTDAGRSFAYHAKQMLEINNDLYRELSSQKATQNTFVIGTPSFQETHIMPAVVPVLKKKYPSLRFHIVAAPLVEMMARLEGGELQAVFALQHPLMEGAATVPVLHDRVLIMLPPGHRFYRPELAGMISAPWFELSELDGDPFLMHPPNSINRRRFDVILSSLRIRPQVYMESANLEAKFRLVTEGYGISFIPETCVKDMNGWEKPNYIFLSHERAFDVLSVAYRTPHRCIGDLVAALQTVYADRRLPTAPTDGKI